MGDPQTKLWNMTKLVFAFLTGNKLLVLDGEKNSHCKPPFKLGKNKLKSIKAARLGFSPFQWKPILKMMEINPSFSVWCENMALQVYAANGLRRGVQAQLPSPYENR